MQKQRSPQQKRIPRSKPQKRSSQPKKLPLKVRRRNRAIALTLLGLIIFFSFRQCSEDPHEKIVDRNQTVISTPTKELDKNSTTENATKESNAFVLKTKDQTKTKIEHHVLKEGNTKAALLPNDPILAKERLLENYRKKGSYKSALALAEYFYAHKKYKEAVKWAIVTNKLDMNQFRPWYIYIKSKIALGDKEHAKVALKFYLKSHKSKKFDALLKKLEAN